MRIHSLMSVPRCENDVEGRFTKYPPSRFTLASRFIPCLLFGVRLRAQPACGRTGDFEVDGSNPLFEALVRAWGGCGFHMRRTAPWGSLPSELSLREAR